MRCINLRERFGRRYRIAIEEGHRRRNPDPWSLLIVCRYGEIYPFGGDRLAASVAGHRGVAARLRRLLHVKIEQDGDYGELTASFDARHFSEVARIMRPRRRRQVSESQKAELAARLKAVRPTDGRAVAQGGPIGRGQDILPVPRQTRLFDR